jgi:hypothetical protein
MTRKKRKWSSVSKMPEALVTVTPIEGTLGAGHGRFIIELPESQGYDTVLVAADQHTKRAHFIPSVSLVSAEGSAQLFRDHMWKHHGWAKKIITD